MSESERPPLYIASSYMEEHAEDPYGSLPTAGYAFKVGADGTQTFVNFREDPAVIREIHRQLGLKQIVHIPGELTVNDLQNQGKKALKIAAAMADPIPDLGVVCITHHNAFADSPDAIANTLYSALNEATAPYPDSTRPILTIGFENFYPSNLTTNENIGDQVKKYGELLLYLQDQGLPVIPVFDIPRLHSRGKDGEQLVDPEDIHLKSLMAAVQGQKLLVHATDKIDPLLSGKVPGNATRVGTGWFTQKYHLLKDLTDQHGVTIIGVADESEKPFIENKEQLEETREIFQ